ncbi:methyltransferase [Marivita hallyeonensis]|uniref:Demethylspheroidene O-methyltransferase n=1 Tax=Marivita hallyeonensis TaxID=996342 RepID=A0A1M5UFK0_9RHOB|nr:methyltransferase [Marivita hallyeonensis]SHH61710.1 demethylspheroidene O-methyltransferase [Marivita hallyeonensis]
MALATDTPPATHTPKVGLRTRLMRLIARPGFQRWASTSPLTRGVAAKDGAALFDIVQGFVKSQALFALVELRVLHRLMDGARSATDLAGLCVLPLDRMERLLQAGVAMDLLRRDRKGRYGLARQGAALVGVPGLEDMIRHHAAFYRDLNDPVALLRGDVQTELAQFWPYVFGAENATDSDVSNRYSDLMARSQEIVAADTLATVRLNETKSLLDIGGGYGVFAEALVLKYPNLTATVFDLPAVAPNAIARIEASKAKDRLSFVPGSFRDDPLPRGADTISLIRVLYDHEDDTVAALLAKVFEALPEGGRLLVSEPMSGGAKPEIAGDVYFSFYCMAMQTGTVRSAERIGELCRNAGFQGIKTYPSRRPFVTSVLTALKTAT